LWATSRPDWIGIAPVDPTDGSRNSFADLGLPFGTTTGVFKMSKENQNKSSGQQDKNKEIKGEDKKLKTMEPGDDPNDVAPTGVGGKQR
jgi:hypothetical protein